MSHCLGWVTGPAEEKRVYFYPQVANATQPVWKALGWDALQAAFLEHSV
jgi:hypothetical protein